MNRELDVKSGEKNSKNYKKNSLHLENVIVATPDEKESNPVEELGKIFSESCEPRRSEDDHRSQDSEGLKNIENEIETVENIVNCETALLTKSATHTDQGLYEIENENDSENLKNTEDNEEAVLLTGIAKIFITQTAAQTCQNEKTNLSSGNLSSKEARDKQEENLGKQSKKKGVLAMVDTLFSVLVVAPFVVSCWRGLWSLLDVYHEIFSAHMCFLLGMGCHTMFAILKHYFHDKFAEELKVKSFSARLGYRLVSISYTYVFAAACIMHWRGGWLIFDHCITTYKWFLRSVTSAGVVIAILLRSVRNLIAPPYIVAIDRRGYIFQFPTRFNVNTRDWFLYILDCAFSVVVVGTLVVFVWRGVWVLLDLYLFPDNPEYSAVGSIVIGYTIVVITFSLQPLMRYACTRLKGLPRLAAVDIFLLLSFLGTVNVWRGIWNVLGLWLLPEDPELSCWITHLGCFIFLVLLNCSNSILVRGVYIDAEEEEGKCAVFPCHYLRLFFKIEREKKEARRQNLDIVASRDLATITERTEKEENEAMRNISDSANVAQNPESHV